MPSDRDLAQQWLAERIHAEQCGCGSSSGSSAHLAAAILDTPGVEVGRLLTPMTGERRLVIKLPQERCPRCGATSHGMACPALLRQERREQP